MDGPRQVRKEEVGDLVDMLSDVFPFRDWYSRDYMVPRMSRARSRRETLVIAEDGRPVSHIRTVYNNLSIYGCRVKVASIGSVGTHRDHRGRGYAGAILQQTMKQMVERGAKVLIVSGDRSLYRRAHCAPAGRLYKAEVRRSDLEERASDLHVRRVQPDEWPLLAPIHQAEPVRFVRDVQFFSKLVFWWDSQYPQIWAVESDGRPVAYASLILVWGKESETQRRVAAEYAGSRAALMDALPALFEAADLQLISLEVLGHDAELLHLLRRRGISPTLGTLSGTHRILDLPGLMRRLRPYLAARLPRPEMRRLRFDQSGDQCIVSYGDERIQCTLSEAAPLVLGGPGAPEVTGELERVLSAIFPIPFPTPGFNYI